MRFMIEPKRAILQADLVYLLEDEGYKYALAEPVVDVSTGLSDAEPVKTHSATDITAFKKI